MPWPALESYKGIYWKRPAPSLLSSCLDPSPPPSPAPNPVTWLSDNGSTQNPFPSLSLSSPCAASTLVLIPSSTGVMSGPNDSKDTSVYCIVPFVLNPCSGAWDILYSYQHLAITQQTVGLKGQCHEYVLMVFKVFQKLSLPYTEINFLFASLKLLTSLKNAYFNPFQSSLCDWLIFCIADLSLAARKMRKN